MGYNWTIAVIYGNKLKYMNFEKRPTFPNQNQEALEKSPLIKEDEAEKEDKRTLTEVEKTFREKAADVFAAEDQKLAALQEEVDNFSGSQEDYQKISAALEKIKFELSPMRQSDNPAEKDPDVQSLYKLLSVLADKAKQENEYPIYSELDQMIGNESEKIYQETLTLQEALDKYKAEA